MGSIPGRGTKIPHATQHGLKKRKEKSFQTPTLIDYFNSLLPQDILMFHQRTLSWQFQTNVRTNISS